MTARSSGALGGTASVSSAVAVARLTALWALAESALGGLVHALRVPLSGLVMAGTAVLLISLIAHFAARPRDILRATLLVLIVKAVGAPHTQLVGYLAVAFQGLFAFALYSVWPPGRGSTLVFAVVALLETAMQKLLTLAIFFGMPLWDAVDEWGGWILERYFPAYVDAEFSLAMSLVGVYLGIYFVGGLAIGYIAGRLPGRIASERAQLALSATDLSDHGAPAFMEEPIDETGAGVDGRLVAKTRPRARPRWRSIGGWLAVAGVLAATVYASPGDLPPVGSALVYLVRTLAILSIWYLLVGPWLSRALRRWLLAREEVDSVELERLLEALPLYRQLATDAYRSLARHHTGLGLWRRWVPRVLTLSLMADPPTSPIPPRTA